MRLNAKPEDGFEAGLNEAIEFFHSSSFLKRRLPFSLFTIL